LTRKGTKRTVFSNIQIATAAAPAAGSFHPLAERKERIMFTRVVELTSKPRKSRELSSLINDTIVPILKKQAGFVDEIVLVSDADSNRVLALSFWKTREDAERYQREQYNSVRETMQPLLEGEPVVRTFEVHTSTGHKIAAGKAA
jgi:quinol monooxygenase YgiN